WLSTLIGGPGEDVPVSSSTGSDEDINKAQEAASLASQNGHDVVHVKATHWGCLVQTSGRQLEIEDGYIK
ncbi:MAG: hypothetical protein LH660_17125, partial [Phormidesmis sp. CAN_BIN36]|nr:hypothetical protein [Phormidesmis sp. CAN_BIN36]